MSNQVNHVTKYITQHCYVTILHNIVLRYGLSVNSLLIFCILKDIYYGIRGKL